MMRDNHVAGPPGRLFHDCFSDIEGQQYAGDFSGGVANLQAAVVVRFLVDWWCKGLEDGYDVGGAHNESSEVVRRLKLAMVNDGRLILWVMNPWTRLYVYAVDHDEN